MDFTPAASHQHIAYGKDLFEGGELHERGVDDGGVGGIRRPYDIAQALPNSDVYVEWAISATKLTYIL